MPPPDSRLQLTDAEKKTLRAWIEQGRRLARALGVHPAAAAEVPAVKNMARVNNPIDAFILARLEGTNIEPVARADRETLIRRLLLDIVGLPPTPEEVDAFVNDTSPDAYEKLVDRLLASEHFGERLAIYWLDVVRYADSVGYHKDSHRDCWMYRDWVIEAFNDNKPYDQFVTEQLAGDLLTEGTKFDVYRRQIASGFNRLNQTTSEGGAQAKEYLAKYSADRVRNTSAIFLGTTMGCAECHDHKYDPFTTQDFYQFAAFFADINERGVGYPQHTAMPNLQQIDEWEALEAEKAKALLELEKNSSAGQSQDAPTEAIAKLQAEIKSLDERIAKLSDAKKWSKTLVTNTTNPRPIRVLPARQLAGRQPAGGRAGGSRVPGRRRSRRPRDAVGPAKWITEPGNPLTARTMVNRLWRIYFGEGLSRTLDDLGAQGAWPTHPELLDWLALEFVDSGWDVKHVIKLMVMSDAYQRTSFAPRSCGSSIRKIGLSRDKPVSACRLSWCATTRWRSAGFSHRRCTAPA